MNSIETLIKKSRDYLDTKIELTKLKAVNTSSDVLSTLIYLIVKILIIFLLIGFTSVAVAILIGKTLRDYYYGFLIIGGIYLFVLLIIYIQSKNWIKGPIANSLINKMLK